MKEDVLDVVGKIPGGQHGNNPGSFAGDPTKGVVVVELSTLVRSIRWINRRGRIGYMEHGGPNLDPDTVLIAYHLQASE
jgi:hypothetical protein